MEDIYIQPPEHQQVRCGEFLLDNEVTLVEIGVLEEDGYLSLEMSKIDNLDVVELQEEEKGTTAFYRRKI